MQRHDDVGKTPVIRVALELHDDFFRRIIPVLPENHVEERCNAVIQEKRQEQPKLIAGRRMQRNACERL
jgi:hypothetical protein